MAEAHIRGTRFWLGERVVYASNRLSLGTLCTKMMGISKLAALLLRPIIWSLFG